MYEALGQALPGKAFDFGLCGAKPPHESLSVRWENGNMMKTVYEHPRYYEIAFSYRDIGAEVDTFEQCFQKYAELSVKSILEVGCGNSPHMEELLKRGYAYTGLDISA